MEPGLRDREYVGPAGLATARQILLQWSPVLETGNTSGGLDAALRGTAGCNGARS